jgi:hypothetical protein
MIGCLVDPPGLRSVSINAVQLRFAHLALFLVHPNNKGAGRFK